MASLPPAHQESEHIGAGITLRITLWVTLFSVALCFAAIALLSARSRTLSRAQSEPEPVSPAPEVHNIRTELFTRPAAGELLNARQRSELRGYGWVDRERGIVSIPIDVAIDLEVLEGKR